MIVTHAHGIEPELRQPVPRKIAWGSSLLGAAFLILCSIPIAIMCAYDYYSHYLFQKQGIVTQGKVISKYQMGGRGGPSSQVYYEFTVNGTTITGRSGVSSETYSNAKAGAPISVMYMPGKPEQHHAGDVSDDQLGSLALTYGVLVAIWMGISTLVFYLTWKSSRDWLWLIRYGSATSATIIRLDQYSTSAKSTPVVYTFSAGNQTIKSDAYVLKVNGKHWKVGDTLTVLYDPDRPSHHELYRRMSTAGKARA